MKKIIVVLLMMVLFSTCSGIFPKRICKIKNNTEMLSKINKSCDSFGMNSYNRYVTKIVKNKGFKNNLKDGFYHLTDNGKCRDCDAEAYVLISNKELIVLPGMDDTLFLMVVKPFMLRNGYRKNKIKKGARYVFGLRGWRKVIQ